MIPKNPDHRLAKGAIVFALLTVVFMTVWSIVHWPDMAPSIVTRHAGGNHGTSRVSRGVTAVAMPLALLVTTVALAVAPALDAKIARRLFTLPQKSGRGSARVLGATLVGLSILFGTLHVVFVGLHTGSGIPIEKSVGVATGIMLVIVGVYVPLGRPDGTHASPRMEAFRAAQGPAFRVAGFATVVLGLALIAVSLIRPSLVIVVGPVGIGLICGGIFVKALLALRRS